MIKTCWFYCGVRAAFELNAVSFHVKPVPYSIFPFDLFPPLPCCVERLAMGESSVVTYDPFQ